MEYRLVKIPLFLTYARNFFETQYQIKKCSVHPPTEILFHSVEITEQNHWDYTYSTRNVHEFFVNELKRTDTEHSDLGICICKDLTIVNGHIFSVDIRLSKLLKEAIEIGCNCSDCTLKITNVIFNSIIIFVSKHLKVVEWTNYTHNHIVAELANQYKQFLRQILTLKFIDTSLYDTVEFFSPRDFNLPWHIEKSDKLSLHTVKYCKHRKCVIIDDIKVCNCV